MSLRLISPGLALLALAAFSSIAFADTSAEAFNTCYQNQLAKFKEDCKYFTAAECQDSGASSGVAVDSTSPIESCGQYLECVRAASTNQSALATITADCQKQAAEQVKDYAAEKCEPSPLKACPDTTDPAASAKAAASPKATKAKAATQSAKNTTPQSVPAASSDSNSDINLCQSAFSSAQSCCGNPTSCMNSNEQAQYAQYQAQASQPPMQSSPGAQGQQGSGGMTAACQQSQAANTAAQNANGLAAGVCSVRQNDCNTTCTQLISKYQALVNNCAGCDSSSVYQSTLSTLMAKRQQCSQLTASLSNLTSQSASAFNGANGSAACAQMSGMNPQSMTPNSSDPNSASDPYGCSKDPTSAACQSCSANPNSTACQAMAAASTREQGSGSFTAPSTSNQAQKFDLPDPADLQAGMAIQGGKSDNAPTVNTIANNSGGAIPGQGGGSTGGARLDGPSRPGAHASGGVSTDIDQGLRSGGGYNYSGAVGNTDRPDASSPYFGNRGSGRAPASAGVDLRQFLPGGPRDPNARVLGAQSADALGIHGRFVDIWARISDRMQEKCRLGELMGCQ